VAVILERLLAKNPAYRFVTPAELAAALQPFATGCTLQGLTDANSLQRSDYRAALSAPLRQATVPQSHLFTWMLFACAFLVGIALGVAFLMTRPGKTARTSLAHRKRKCSPWNRSN